MPASQVLALGALHCVAFIRYLQQCLEVSLISDSRDRVRLVQAVYDHNKQYSTEEEQLQSLAQSHPRRSSWSFSSHRNHHHKKSPALKWKRKRGATPDFRPLERFGRCLPNQHRSFQERGMGIFFFFPSNFDPRTPNNLKISDAGPSRFYFLSSSNYKPSGSFLFLFSFFPSFLRRLKLRLRNNHG